MAAQDSPLLPVDATGGGDSGSGPLLALVARGLEIWLRQQCDSIERLEIRLNGTAQRLLRGQLEGVSLFAQRVVYKDLQFERVDLRSDTIRVRVGQLLRGGKLELDQTFHVRGEVIFTGEGLSRSLSSDAWRSIGDELAEKLLGFTPLSRLQVRGHHLILSAIPSGSDQPVDVETQISATGGTVAIRGVEGNGAVTLPMDPSISIEEASLGAGLLQLRGEARVSP